MLRPAAGGLDVVTSQAALFRVGREAIESGSTTGPLENPGEKAIAIKFEDPIAIDDTSSVMLNQAGDTSILVYNPKRETERLRRVTMPLLAGLPESGGVVAGGGLFLPLNTGRAVLVDWRTGAVSSAPFQPDSDPVGKVKWTNPISLPDDPDQVVLADSRKKLYRLRVGEQIRDLQTKDLEYELLGQAAGIGDSMIATTVGPAADFLVGFEMTSLNEKFKTLLNGRVIWGPVAAGDLCLVETDDSTLRAFTADGVQKFELALPGGKPAGKPLRDGETIILAGTDGWIVALDAGSGKLLGQRDLGQPVSATPLLAGKRLLVPGAEGVVYVTEVPAN
jgi:outer membrane protein assembly factor BamB